MLQPENTSQILWHEAPLHHYAIMLAEPSRNEVSVRQNSLSSHQAVGVGIDAIESSIFFQVLGVIRLPLAGNASEKYELASHLLALRT
jgi:hypothetical protein